MPRLSMEDREFCKRTQICVDCYREGQDTLGLKLQLRGNYEVPCCPEHFYKHRNKINKAEAEKYARSSAEKVKTRQCTYKGCHRKLIPQEVLPPRIQETTCGMHVGFKAFRVNRNTILRLIIEPRLTPEEREMTVQCVIYRRREGLVFVSLSEPRLYLTKCYRANDLDLHKKLR